MKIKGAMTILNKRCDFFGFTLDQLIEFIERNPMAQDLKTLQAYEVYKMDQGYTWSGVNFETWVKKENI